MTQTTPLIAHTKEELIQSINLLINKLNKQNARLGFVPTMGALHNGHKSLIEKSIKDNDISIVSIFVNPTQFAPTEDLSKYPRTIESDLKLCQATGVSIVFLPNASEMYGDDEISLQPPKGMGYVLEGYYRPTHFAGVLQVVLKLFNLILPRGDRQYGIYAYFGRKDAQQLLILQKMVKDLFLPINIIGMPIIRDSDNLALSSRNVYLDSKERALALALPNAILKIESMIKQDGVTDTAILKKVALEILQDIKVDYMDFYNHELKLVNDCKMPCIFLAAIRIGKVRLLDNLWIE